MLQSLCIEVWFRMDRFAYQAAYYIKPHVVLDGSAKGVTCTPSGNHAFGGVLATTGLEFELDLGSFIHVR